MMNLMELNINHILKFIILTEYEMDKKKHKRVIEDANEDFWKKLIKRNKK